MQTILGANGQIAVELAKEINAHYSKDLRLVSRNPKQVNGTDQLFSANLLDASKTAQAVSGSSVVYLTVGLPLDTQTWIDQFPPIMRNTIDACKKHRAKLVFFDNTYMYPQNSNPLTEETAFAPVGPKGRVRAAITTMLLDEMKAGNIEAVICRAPEFYGRDKTFSYTNTLLFDPIREHRTPRVLLRDDTLRTLIWSPDASRATALIGNTSDAFNQTWHLPCDDNRRTYKEIIGIAEAVIGEQISYRILNKTTLKLVSFFKKPLREMKELLPRYEQDNLFISDKFKKRFPRFDIKQYQEGIEDMLQ
ncbi:MAG TPA: NAD-dependent epimerase/dehydratase family protein [Pseudobacter sp.]|nr:NAD-dependent epimerase/dehydratase family protein [Pseudobacter sp.]